VRILSQRSATATIIGIGIALRLLFLLLIADKPLMSDAVNYNDMAVALVRGIPLVPLFPPGLPLYLSLIHRALGDSVLVLRLAMLVFYGGLSFFVYRIAMLLTGDKAVGNLSLLLLALAPETIHLSLDPWTEMPTAMLLAAVVYFLLRTISTASRVNAVFLGLCVGYLALLRPSSLIFVILLPLYLGWRLKSLITPLTAGMIAILLVATWIGYVHGKIGRFVQINTANAKNLYYGNNPITPLYRTWWLGSHHEKDSDLLQNVSSPASDPISQDAEFSRLAKEHILQRPDLFLLRSFNRVCVYFALDPFTGAYLIEDYGFPKLLGLLVIALDAGIYFVIAASSILYFATLGSLKYRKQTSFILLAITVLYAAPYFVAFSHPRFRFPLNPLLMILCSAFLIAILSQPQTVLREIQHHKAGLVVALVAFALIQVEFLLMMADRL